MRQTGAIALNTFRETIRDRVLGIIVLFALFMIVASLWLGSISLGEAARVMKDFGLVAVSFFGLVVAAFIAAGLVHREVERRTVFVIFSKPVSRAAFITGKFLGLALTMAVVVAGMGLFLFFVAWAIEGSPSWLLLAAVSLIYLQLIVIVAVTILFSTLGSAILASILGISVFAIGQLSTNVLSLSRLGDNTLTQVFSWVVFVLVPNFTAVDIKPAVVGEQSAQWGSIALWSLYLVAYMTAVLLLATFAFSRREF